MPGSKTLTTRKRPRSSSAQENSAKAPPSPPTRSEVQPRITNGLGFELDSKEVTSSDPFKSKWNPRDPLQMKSAKESFHASTTPENVVCRETEQTSILEFCKACIQQERPGSLYACGCPGTGKSLSIDKVSQLLVAWSKEMGYKSPEILMFNCTTLTCTSSIINKVLEIFCHGSKQHCVSSPLQYLQKLFSQKITSSGRMMMLVLDEMDYLITRDNAILHDLFMLTTFPFSPCILIGIANAIDLTDRFLPKLKMLNCEPVVVNFHAYGKDQILEILTERLNVLEYYDVFEPSAIEFCARKVSAASGDMRRALDICRNAIEALEADLCTCSPNNEINMVTFDHMQVTLSKAFQPAIVDIIQSLPRHQQIILCSLTKLFHESKRHATTILELNKAYSEVCKSNQIPAVGAREFSDMCGYLSDQGLLKLGKAKDDKQKRVTLQIDSSEVFFALKGVRFFANFMHK